MKKHQAWRYVCDFCNRGFWKENKALYHENHCLRNPLRLCGLCEQFDREQESADNLDHVMYATGDDRDVLRASECPLCTLAAIYRANSGLSKEERYYFDYAKAMEQVRGQLPAEVI